MKTHNTLSRRLTRSALATVLAGTALAALSLAPIRMEIHSRFVQRPVAIVNVNRTAALAQLPATVLSKQMRSYASATTLRQLALPKDDAILKGNSDLFGVGIAANELLPHADRLALSGKPNASPDGTLPTLNYWHFESVPKPRVTEAQLAQDIKSRPNDVLRSHHAGVAEVAKQFDASSNGWALVALAQALKAGVDADDPAAPFNVGALMDRAEASDAIVELAAAVVEAEHYSPGRASDVAQRASHRKWLIPSSESFDIQLLVDELAFTGQIESRLVESLRRLQQRDHGLLQNTIWGRYLGGTQATLAIDSLSLDADGVAHVKLNSPEFSSVTGKIPCRQMAQSLANYSNEPEPELKMLMPKN